MVMPLWCNKTKWQSRLIKYLLQNEIVVCRFALPQKVATDIKTVMLNRYTCSEWLG